MIRFFGFIAFIFLFTPDMEGQNLDNELTAIITPLINSIRTQPVKNVAISDFTLLDGTPTELGKYLAEEFSFSLVNAPNKTFVVIDRSRVTALLQEANLGNTGKIDPNTIAKLGKMKGIDAVIAGTLTSTGNTLRLIIKVWNLESQGLVAASKGDISKTPMIIELEGKVSTSTEGGSIAPAVPPTNQSPAISKFTHDNLTFELLSCTQSGQNVVCITRAVNKNKDIDLGINCAQSGGRIISASGNEYPLIEAKLGDKTTNGNYSAVKSMVADIPINCTFTFGRVTEKIDFIPKMDMGLPFNGFALEFRNIKVKQ